MSEPSERKDLADRLNAAASIYDSRQQVPRPMLRHLLREAANVIEYGLFAAPASPAAPAEPREAELIFPRVPAHPYHGVLLTTLGGGECDRCGQQANDSVHDDPSEGQDFDSVAPTGTECARCGGTRRRWQPDPLGGGYYPCPDCAPSGASPTTFRED